MSIFVQPYNLEIIQKKEKYPTTLESKYVLHLNLYAMKFLSTPPPTKVYYFRFLVRVSWTFFKLSQSCLNSFQPKQIRKFVGQGLLPKTAVLVFLLFFSSSCATLFRGASENITFSSDPEGAEIFIDGFSEGKTPATIIVDKSVDGVVRYQKKGYETKEFKLKRKFDNIAFLNFFGLIGWAVDYVTGALYEIPTTNYDYELEKLEESEDTDKDTSSDKEVILQDKK